MRGGVLLSVREKSTRLPGKVIAPVHGKNVTSQLVARLQMARLPEQVVIATSDDPRHGVFDGIGRECGVAVFHGSQDDKLLRYRDACRAFEWDFAVVVDGDDLLCFPEFIDRAIEHFRANPGFDAVFTRGLPLGAAASLLSRSALDKVVELKAEADTEVWGGYFIGSGHFNVGFLEAEAPFRRPEVRMTLDYQEDMDFFLTIFDELYPSNPRFSSRDVMELLERRPDIVGMNAVAQAKYEGHISGAAPVRFKS